MANLTTRIPTLGNCLSLFPFKISWNSLWVKEHGAREKYFILMSENAMRDICRFTNPKELLKEDFVEIYRKANITINSVTLNAVEKMI
jgi:hypothetical protein